MTNIAIDYGNSRVQIGVFKDSELTFSKELVTSIDDKILDIISDNNPDNIIVSSVVGYGDFHWQSKIDIPIIFLDDKTALPFKNLYKTPKTIGKDRICAVAGAQILFPNENVLIIDAGTAITYDFLTKDSEYIGGNISPGLEMRFKALNFFTKNLPLVENDDYNSFIGQSTNEAISSGVINGMLFEISGYIEDKINKWECFKTIITGGDASFFVKKLNFPIFANQNLVLIGLNRILEYNV